MPLRFDQMNAKISHYQGNGPLNALVHIIVDKMPLIPDDPLQDGHRIKEEVLAAFEAEWGTSLGPDGWNRLQAILRDIQDPSGREILLGPVLRRMLPADQNLPPLSDASISGLAKRFGIRAEFYEDFAGMRARLKETILRNRPGLEAAPLEAELRRQFRTEAAARLRQLAQNDPAILEAELKRIDNGLLPSYAAPLVDTLQAGHYKLRRNAPGHLATLSVYRQGTDYGFGASNQGDPEDLSSIDTATHNYHFGSHTKHAVYEETAPGLKPLLQSAIHRAIFERSEGLPVDEEALVRSVSKLFGNETTKATDEQKDGPLGGMMDGVLKGVETFFSKDIFGSLRGMMELFESLLGPIMKMLLGFQDAIMEMNKKPGDPLTKKEREKDPVLQRAAESFATWVEALGEHSSAAKHLNQAWRANPDSTDVWVGLMEALIEDGQLNEAHACLHAKEETLLERLETLRKETEDAGQNQQATFIQRQIQDYHGAIAALQENATLREDQGCLEARLGLFKEVDLTLQAFTEKHQALKDTEQKEQVLLAEQRVLQQEQAVGADMLLLQARLRKVQDELAAYPDRIRQLAASKNGVIERPANAEAIVREFQRCQQARDVYARREAAGAARQRL